MLSIDSHEEGSRYTLLLSGELDMASAPQLEGRVQQLSSRGQGELVLDLSGLDFIDSSGLNAILRVRALCQEQMWEFCMMPGERPVQRLFEVTRLIDRLPFRKPRKGAPRDALPQVSRTEPEPDG